MSLVEKPSAAANLSEIVSRKVATPVWRAECKEKFDKDANMFVSKLFHGSNTWPMLSAALAESTITVRERIVPVLVLGGNSVIHLFDNVGHVM